MTQLTVKAIKSRSVRQGAPEGEKTPLKTHEGYIPLGTLIVRNYQGRDKATKQLTCHKNNLTIQ